MSEQCGFCRLDLLAKRIIYTTKYKGRVVVVENVPALVCPQCGETLFRPEVVEKLQKMVWDELPPTKTMEVPVYNFAEVE